MSHIYMRFLSGEEKIDALNFMNAAAELALKAECDDAKCGTVIVKNNKVIGYGCNSPPNGSKKRCHIKKSAYHNRVTDKTFCIHAEQRAILDALQRNADKVAGSRLYFIRVSDTGDILKAGKPFCTICSKYALDAGIKEFVLWHDKGICVYDTNEYNDLSFAYDE